MCVIVLILGCLQYPLMNYLQLSNIFKATTHKGLDDQRDVFPNDV